MPKVISTKLVIEGESEYKRKLNEVNATLATHKAELSKVKAETAGQANTLASLTQKQKALDDVLQTAKARVAAATTAFDAAREAQQKYAQQVTDCKAALETAKKALADYGAAGTGSAEELKRLSDEVEACTRNLADAESVQDKAQRAVAA